MATTARRAVSLALAHALCAAERGFPVIPLSPTKLPAIPSPHRHTREPIPNPIPAPVPAAATTTAPAPAPAPATCHGECGRPGHGVHDATTDPAAVRALFAAAPWATGYGIACGRPPYHLIGIDLDTKSAAMGGGPDAGGAVDSLGALRHLALQHLFTIPETITVLTPSGGRHLWLTGPPGVVVPNSAGRLAPGIDVRGSGGYLVGPGSVSAHGAYRFAPGTATPPPAPCPRALLRLLMPPARHPHGRMPPGDRAPRGEGLVRFVGAADEGQRNTRLFWAACRAYENGIGDSLADALAGAAVHAGLSEREARATIASAARLRAGGLA
ncbi:bifunctional DNA primase/polymerase [Streptomyces sp. NPDC019396]|uniref:bifunctional DNA primase/polymerase n=1 Tax=Streptomyces sp. NPDC019396 TaxID=3154687 RepID=UPI0033ED53DC